jgi:hypothetical protein
VTRSIVRRGAPPHPPLESPRPRRNKTRPLSQAFSSTFYCNTAGKSEQDDGQGGLSIADDAPEISSRTPLSNPPRPQLDSDETKPDPCLRRLVLLSILSQRGGGERAGESEQNDGWPRWVDRGE